MGIVSRLVGRESTKDFAELDENDLVGFDNSTVQMRFVDIQGQDDVINAQEEIHNDNIVMADIAYIESNGLSLDSVYADVNQTVQKVNGDIIHKKRSDLIIAVPRDVSINRNKL